MKIILCRSRHQYDSYIDFWRLVAVSGFEVIYVDEMDLTQEAVYVFTPFNGESKPAILAARERAGAALRGKVVWWNLERPDTGDWSLLADVRSYVDDIWVSDHGYAAKFDMRFVMIGSHPDLGAALERKEYDVCTLAYLWGRRQAVANQLVERDLTVAPQAWKPAEKNEVVGRSRLMLNMHQYPTALIIAPIRFAVAAAYQLPLLTESVDDAEPLVDGKHFVQAPYEQLVDKTVEMVRAIGAYRYLGGHLYNLLCIEQPFASHLHNAIAELGWA